MKIAILSPFYPFRGGLAQLNARLLAELSKHHITKAFSFTTLYPEFIFPGKTQFVGEDDSPTIVESERILSSINPISYLRTARSINQYAPDVLIIPYWMSYLAPALGTVSALINKRTKIISLVHNAISHEKHFLDTCFAKYFFNRCDAFITMSQPVKEDLLALKKNATILLQDHPIYDQYREIYDRGEACRKLKIDAQKHILLFFGFIRDYKGLDILIDAMQYVDDNYQLIIAGECYRSFDKYSAQIDKSPNKDRILVLEQYIPDDMVTDLFSASDVLILPYKSATQSGVVAMAYQLETPMIATDVGALGSTVRDSNTGLVVANATGQEVAAGINNFFAMNNTAMYTENLKKEKTRLSWSNFIQSVESFIASI